MSSRIPDKDFQWLKAALAELEGRRRQRTREHVARPSGVVQGLEPPQRSAHASALGVACVLRTLRRAADADHADVRISARPPLVRRTHHRDRRRAAAVLRAGVLGGPCRRQPVAGHGRTDADRMHRGCRSACRSSDPSTATSRRSKWRRFSSSAATRSGRRRATDLRFMQAIAEAHPNIALVKYWGKRDGPDNVPGHAVAVDHAVAVAHSHARSRRAGQSRSHRHAERQASCATRRSRRVWIG